MSKGQRIRVLIAGRQEVARSALEAYLHLRPELEVMAVAADTPDLLAQAEAAVPDVILVDWDLFNGLFEDLVSALHQLDCQPKVILLGSSLAAEQAAHVSGVDAFVSRYDPPRSLLAAIHTVHLEGQSE